MSVLSCLSLDLTNLGSNCSLARLTPSGISRLFLELVRHTFTFFYLRPPGLCLHCGVRFFLLFVRSASSPPGSSFVERGGGSVSLPAHRWAAVLFFSDISLFLLGFLQSVFPRRCRLCSLFHRREERWPSPRPKPPTSMLSCPRTALRPFWAPRAPFPRTLRFVGIAFRFGPNRCAKHPSYVSPPSFPAGRTFCIFFFVMYLASPFLALAESRDF